MLLPVCLQNAECLLLFPVPLARPGFYSQSLAQFSSCVPAAACPGMDAALVNALYQGLLVGGSATGPQLNAILQQFFSVFGSGNSSGAVSAPDSVGVPAPRPQGRAGVGGGLVCSR